MHRAAIFATTILFLSPTAFAQDGGENGGGNTGGDQGTQITGETTDTEIESRGVETGRIEDRTSAFDVQDEGSAFTLDNQGQVIRRGFSDVGNANITNGGTTSTQRQVKPRFRLGFVPSAAFMARSRRRAVSQFNSIVPRVRTLSGVSITPDQNGAVTLRGQADSRYDQLLAAAIARLQPGVKRIRNEIRVTPQATRLQSQPMQMAPSQARPQRPVEAPPEIILPRNPAATAPLQPLAPVRNSNQLRDSVIINPPVPPAATPPRR